MIAMRESWKGILFIAIVAPLAAQSPLRILPGAAPDWTVVRNGGDVNADGFSDLVVFRDEIDDVNRSVRVYSGADGAVLHDFFGDDSFWLHAGDSAGDVNGDGHDDVIVGSRWSNLVGGVRVYSGSDGALLHELNGTTAVADQFGWQVFPAGDVNGDGFDDFGVSSRDRTQAPHVYSIRVFSGIDGTELLMLPTAGQGRSAECAGDVNGDGFDDIVAEGVFAWNQADVVHVFSGFDGSTILEIPASVFAPPGTPSSWLSALQVDSAGDVDRDGFDDLIIGMPDFFLGAFAVVSGNTGGLLYYYDDPGASFGYVTGAGDVNGDGYADFAASERLDATTFDEAGALYVYSGIDGSLIHTFYGNVEDEQLGFSVDGGRGCDVDGDGFDDVLAGTWASIAYAFDLGATGNPGRLRARGVGCVGSNGRLPTIDARGYAQLGDAFDVTLRGGLDGGAVSLLVGTPVELALDPAGLFGCTLHTAAFFSVGVTNDAHGMASIPVSVTPDPASVGLELSMQWISWDAGIAPIPARVTGGLQVVVGS